MDKRCVILAVAGCLAASTVGWAFDTVKTTEDSILGTVQKTHPLQVTVEQGAITKEVAVNEIEAIYYDGEPALLKTARTAIPAGRYEDAVAALEKIKLDDVSRLEIKQDIDFYKALARARIALAGTDEETVKEAGKLMAAFVKGHTASYHYLEACEVLGNLYVAIGQSAAAQAYYAQLAKAPWPDYKMRAGVALGNAQLAEGETAVALKSFQDVLDTEAQGELADRQRLAATLGKGQCLAETNQDEAVKLVEGVIDKANPEQIELHARAYNTLGLAHRKAGRTKDALLAFLHVDILYFSSPKDHIEALQNLIELWNEVQNPERAADAAQILSDQYKRSPRSN